MLPLRIEDAEAIFRGWATDPEVVRYLTWRPSRSVDETRRFVEQCVEAWRGTTRRVWTISRIGELEPIGMIELRLDGLRATLGYVLARAAWGHGYMTEAVQNVAHTALREVPFARVDAMCDVDNRASVRVLEKSGMLREGRLRRYGVHPNLGDEPRDVYLYARTRPLNARMDAQDVLTALATLAERNAEIWIGGGWGIDALVREQTREHADLDLAFQVEQEATVLDALMRAGYRLVLDHRPGRIVLADDDGREIDLHPVQFDGQGNGVQIGMHGEVFHYPADGFTEGAIDGERVRCLSVAQQLRFHSGYELRDFERRDVERLRAVD
jgi:lincosamide nucleotidyltransferase A/C/D/E